MYKLSFLFMGFVSVVTMLFNRQVCIMVESEGRERLSAVGPRVCRYESVLSSPQILDMDDCALRMAFS